ncbi:hypothetical protein Poli38472_009353 [Pythium oligandrum]|uniref:Ankyrin repeat protein n=1 Tax=Pythium oligandrum TaxID=41045 RepID=A0A8K1CM38_PYTOL|nr:hypothetical protein Poli38472_009353 [Pythium oligandrum]|eukprot:TMW65186.1 hypothetical protein Poli38472_009353 [Pythium oligandrum]
MDDATRSSLFAAAACGDLDTVRSFFQQPQVQRLIAETNRTHGAEYAAALASGTPLFDMTMTTEEPWYGSRRLCNDTMELIFEEPFVRGHVLVLEWFFGEEACGLFRETLRRQLQRIFFFCVRRAPALSTELAEIILSSHLYHTVTRMEQEVALYMLLEEASRVNCLDCVRLVVAHGASLVNPQDALMRGCECGDAAAFQALLDYGLLPGEHEGSLLVHAAAHENPEMVELLLARGFADVNARAGLGMTSLMSVFRRWDQYSRESGIRRSRIVSMLLEKGADVHLRGPSGRTALHRAAMFVHSSEHALNAMADLDEPQETLYEDEIQEVLANLLAYGADLNARSHSWQTPLHTLAECFQYGRYWTPFEILLFRGANPHLSDVNGRTACSILLETWAGRTYVQAYTRYFEQE